MWHPLIRRGRRGLYVEGLPVPTGESLGAGCCVYRWRISKQSSAEFRAQWTSTAAVRRTSQTITIQELKTSRFLWESANWGRQVLCSGSYWAGTQSTVSCDVITITRRKQEAPPAFQAHQSLAPSYDSFKAHVFEARLQVNLPSGLTPNQFGYELRLHLENSSEKIM